MTVPIPNCAFYDYVFIWQMICCPFWHSVVTSQPSWCRDREYKSLLVGVGTVIVSNCVFYGYSIKLG